MNCRRCSTTAIYRDGLCAYCFGFVSEARKSPGNDFGALPYLILAALLIVFAVAMYVIFAAH